MPRSGKKGTFSQLVRQLVNDAQFGFCKDCHEPILDFHHRIPNTKTNRRLYPNFIQSVFNCVGLCRHHHEHYAKYNLMSEEVMSYEIWLRDFAQDPDHDKDN